jgi:hypothetical protein
METNPNSTPIGKAKRQSTIPNKDNDLITVAITVGRNWEKAQELTLAWISQAEFKTCVNDFSSSLSTKNEKGGQRSPVTQKLKLVDKTINSSIKHVKGYLSEKYGEEEAKAYYPKFGIEHSKRGYNLPNERLNRMQALKMVVPALKEEGLEDKKFGTQFWEPIVAMYTQYVDNTIDMDGSIAKHVGNKEHCKQQIRLALNSIIFLLRANYPGTYKSMLREWGFQKEKY